MIWQKQIWKKKLDLNKIEEPVKKGKEFDLVEHELIKLVYIFNLIVNNGQESN